MRIMESEQPLIFIIEDDEMIVDLNTRLLERRGYKVLVSYNLRAARELMETYTPDLYIIDVSLPDGNGFVFCKELRKTDDTPVLFLTGRNRSTDKVEGLDIGCDYYLTKPYDRNELIAAVQMLLRRETRMKKRMEEIHSLHAGALTLHIPKMQAIVNGEQVRLTPTEFLLLVTLVKNKNNPISSDDLYQMIWNRSSVGNTDALRSHISHIKKKISTMETDDYDILYERGKGYIFVTK